MVTLFIVLDRAGLAGARWNADNPSTGFSEFQASKYKTMTSFIGRILSSSFLLLALSPSQPSLAQSVFWTPVGPDGGDARSFASDPHDHSHLYLGTATGWMYESHNGGGEWKRLASIGKRDDLVLDSIVVDSTNSKHLLVGAWVLGSPDGGMYSSNDGGVTWSSEADMKGQSIRALATSVSNSKILVAGTL